MPVKSKYSHYNLGNQKRKSTVVANFAGVDFTNQRFNVSTSRAVNIQNFILRDGVIQKRRGYEEIIKAEPLAYVSKSFDDGTPAEYCENGVNFNGMWKFKAEDGLEHIVAHIGNLLFEIKNIDKETISIEPLVNYGDSASGSGTDFEGNVVSGLPVLYKFEDYKSFAFVGAKRLWFLGGNKYMVIRFLVSGETIVTPVEKSEEVFIPTTTTDITYSDSTNIGNSRHLLDYPNKMTYFRKNKLRSGDGKDENAKVKTAYYEYLLDSPLILNPNQTITNHRSEDIDKIYVVIKAKREKEGGE